MVLFDTWTRVAHRSSQPSRRASGEHRQQGFRRVAGLTGEWENVACHVLTRGTRWTDRADRAAGLADVTRGLHGMMWLARLDVAAGSGVVRRLEAKGSPRLDTWWRLRLLRARHMAVKKEANFGLLGYISLGFILGFMYWVLALSRMPLYFFFFIKNQHFSLFNIFNTKIHN